MTVSLRVSLFVVALMDRGRRGGVESLTVHLCWILCPVPNKPYERKNERERDQDRERERPRDRERNQDRERERPRQRERDQNREEINHCNYNLVKKRDSVFN